MSDKELLIMMTTKCADLERQLAEAREIIEECLSRTSDGNFKDCVRKKLKEQGGE